MLACIVKSLLCLPSASGSPFPFLLDQWQGVEGSAAQGCCGAVQECRLLRVSENPAQGMFYSLLKSISGSSQTGFYHWWLFHYEEEYCVQVLSVICAYENFV